MGLREKDKKTRENARHELDRSRVSRRRLLGLLGCGAAITAASAYKFISPCCASAWPDNSSDSERSRAMNPQGWTKGARDKSAATASVEPSRATQPLLAIARNGNPKQLVDAAIESLGGMGRFVSKGDKVLLKPNIAWDRKPEFAATTNPEAVARVVELCIKAGAKRVTVMDRPCNDPRQRNRGKPQSAQPVAARIQL